MDAATEIAEIHRQMREDRGAYEKSDAPARLAELYASQEAEAPVPVAVEPDDGLPRLLRLAEFQAANFDDYPGYVERHSAVADVLLAVPEPLRGTVRQSFEALPDAVAAAAIAELTDKAPGAVGMATEAELEAFARTRAGRELAKRWGSSAQTKLATLRARMERLGDRAGADATVFDRWLDHQLPDVQVAILARLAG